MVLKMVLVLTLQLLHERRPDLRESVPRPQVTTTRLLGLCPYSLRNWDIVPLQSSVSRDFFPPTPSHYQRVAAHRQDPHQPPPPPAGLPLPATNLGFVDLHPSEPEYCDTDGKQQLCLADSIDN